MRRLDRDVRLLAGVVEALLAIEEGDADLGVANSELEGE
jgi:hypothetical protein